MRISLPHFADDTVFLGEATAEYIRTIKSILRWFELISGLKINFRKSSIMSFNMEDGWTQSATSELHCGVGNVPFVYLDMPVGFLLSIKKMWESFLNRARTILAS